MIFTVLGFMANKFSIPIENIVKSGEKLPPISLFSERSTVRNSIINSYISKHCLVGTIAFTFDYFTDFLHMDIVFFLSTYFNTGNNLHSNKNKNCTTLELI